MEAEGKCLCPEHIQEDYADGQHKPRPVVVQIPCQNRHHPYFKKKKDGGKVDGCEPLFRGSRNFSLGKIEQKDGNQSPGIVLFDGLKNHGARV